MGNQSVVYILLKFLECSLLCSMGIHMTHYSTLMASSSTFIFFQKTTA